MMKKLFLTALIILFSLPVNCQLFGEWHSSFIVMGMSNRLSMSITEDSVIKLSSPDEEFRTTKMNRIVIDNESISFRWDALNLKFAGKYKKDRRHSHSSSQYDISICDFNVFGIIANTVTYFLWPCYY